MLKSILPSSKNDYLMLKEEIKKLSTENNLLKNKLELIEKNNVKNIEGLYQGLYGIIETNRQQNSNQLKDMFSLINEKFEGINNENRENIQKINEEIFSIVNLMNKSMFLEIVNKHKDSLDKVLNTYEK